jgi:hypothetical protein
MAAARPQTSEPPQDVALYAVAGAVLLTGADELGNIVRACGRVAARTQLRADRDQRSRRYRRFQPSDRRYARSAQQADHQGGRDGGTEHPAEGIDTPNDLVAHPAEEGHAGDHLDGRSESPTWDANSRWAVATRKTPRLALGNWATVRPPVRRLRNIQSITPRQ